MRIRLYKNQKIKIETSEDIYKVISSVFKRIGKPQRLKEYFWSIGLDTKLKVTYIEIITIGTMNQNIIDPVELFYFAVRNKIKRLIIVHNHPSGDANPSEADLKLTKELQLAGTILGIEIIDHLIITEVDYYSFNDENQM